MQMFNLLFKETCIEKDLTKCDFKFQIRIINKQFVLLILNAETR